MPVADVTKRIRYYVSSPSAGTLTVIDGLTNNIVQTYTVGLGAYQVVLSNDNTAYVASYTNNVVSILCFDGTIRTLPIPNNGYIEVDGISGKLYVSNSSEVSIYNTASGLLLGTIPGFIDETFLKVTPDRSKLLVLDNNKVKIFSTSTLNPIATIPVGLNPNYILITEDGKRAFISNTGDSTISVIDLTTFTTIITIPLTPGSNPQGLAMIGTTLFVANNGSNDITLINTLNYDVSATTIPTIQPIRLAITPDATKLLATNGSGALTIIDIATKTVEGSIGLADVPFDVAAGYLGTSISPGDPIDLTDSYQLDDITESVCILANKVFSHCQSRDCQNNVVIEPPVGTTFDSIQSVTFGNGTIVPGSLIVTPLDERPNFSRVQFTIDVPVTIKYNNGSTLETSLLPISKDIIMFMPKSRDEFNFDIVLETRTNLLNTPIISGEDIVFAAGVFIVIKVVGEVQLLIPAFGYCPEPPECEDYTGPVPEDVCEIFLDFTQTPFPEDFFPPQYEDINCQL
ncbi:YVTN family beta-propeller protein [Clostridium tetanomorphum]|uniref:hypothetical protein n=1 Tax=Clostridium tetanomorphum TaxID=1553 RepID=UPI000449ECBC|nr:hypothetical protein [Clostridium tetanomorphum]KAJ52021.1 YVTN family beta-propeller domain-containing protein [Clostridium tetanomorphum DSM 665]MBP1862941.1 YVTN family beta-propeller protein [Clostridium tetanomorphum]NRS87078.1 YVTN family beta-propeller protein [Clostridium tetanomorphum]NRZ99127.1 YVTN family beta-propeller protein [Clostridium tetanomorphum]SQC00110.1 40-residue YVTN family beta-propeller repeat-containing protein [Clostridium tetanomorphum]